MKLHRLALACLFGCSVSPVDESPPERVQQTFRMPDGQIITVTGVRRGAYLEADDMLFPLATTRSAAIQTIPTWPNRTVRFVVAGNVSAATRANVLAATAPWAAIGFQFVEYPLTTNELVLSIHSDTDAPWLCSATVGNLQLGSSYNAGSACTPHDYIHEWGHVLGLLHEHERTDRDEYIEVFPEVAPHIDDTVATKGGVNWFDYDFDSIMHYDAFGRDANGNVDTSQVKIRPRDPARPLGSFGFATQPSFLDRLTLSCLYAARTPLYQLYSSLYQDWFYTTNPSERALAMQQYGYADMGIAASVESGPVGGALAFRRLYKGPPQTDHFYTTSIDEATSAQLAGWQEEGAEGYLYPSPTCPHLRALYRYSHWDPWSSDLMHYYTVDASLRPALEAGGWLLEGAAGYVR